MSTHLQPRRGAVGPIRSGATRRPPDSATRLQRLSDRLDTLQRDVNAGPACSHREHERRVAEAEAIADELRGVFRAPTPANGCQSVHPPRFVERREDGSTRAGW